MKSEHNELNLSQIPQQTKGSYMIYKYVQTLIEH